MDFRTLGEWAALADTTPQERPIAVAFFSTTALREFLASLPAATDEDPANAEESRVSRPPDRREAVAR